MLLHQITRLQLFSMFVCERMWSVNSTDRGQHFCVRERMWLINGTVRSQQTVPSKKLVRMSPKGVNLYLHFTFMLPTVNSGVEQQYST